MEIKEILIKDFNEILVKEFCTDWKEKRLYIELLVKSTPFSNLLDYITNLQQENERLKETIKSINAISYQSDDEIWLNVRHDIEDLDEFANDIDHYIAQYITYNYKSHLRAIIKYLVRFFKQHCAYKR